MMVFDAPEPRAHVGLMDAKCARSMPPASKHIHASFLVLGYFWGKYPIFQRVLSWIWREIEDSSAFTVNRDRAVWNSLPVLPSQNGLIARFKRIFVK